MTDREEYDALKKCLGVKDDEAECMGCRLLPCCQTKAESLSRLLTLHGEMVAREIWEHEEETFGANSHNLGQMLDIARKAVE